MLKSDQTLSVLIPETRLLWQMMMLLAINGLSLALPLTVYFLLASHSDLPSTGFALAAGIGAFAFEYFLRNLYNASIARDKDNERNKHLSEMHVKIGHTANPFLFSRQAHMWFPRILSGYFPEKNVNLQNAAMAIDVIFIGVRLALILWLSGPVFLVTAWVLSGFSLIILMRRLALNKIKADFDKAKSHEEQFLLSHLPAIQSIKAMSLERHIESRFESLLGQHGQSRRHYAMACANMQDAPLFTLIMLVLALSSYGGFYMQGIDMPAAVFTASLILSMQTVYPLNRALDSLLSKFEDHTKSSVQNQTPDFDFDNAGDDIKSIIRTLPIRKINWGTTESEHRGYKPKSLVLQNMSHFDETDSPLILKDINLSLTPGVSYVIKSSQKAAAIRLLQLASGICQPEKGEICLDGIPMKHIPPDKIAESVCYLEPNMPLFTGTILSNLTHQGYVDWESIKDILHWLNIEKKLSGLSNGLDTQITAPGKAQLPPSLLQSIAIARALALRPRFIMFNHATHGLDRKTYQSLFQLLGRMKPHVSLLIVSDDSNIQDLAQNKVVIEGGRLFSIANDYTRSLDFQASGRWL